MIKITFLKKFPSKKKKVNFESGQGIASQKQFTKNRKFENGGIQYNKVHSNFTIIEFANFVVKSCIFILIYFNSFLFIVPLLCSTKENSKLIIKINSYYY